MLNPAETLDRKSNIGRGGRQLKRGGGSSFIIITIIIISIIIIIIIVIIATTITVTIARQFDTAGRPIYPNLPYSPYTSPCSSPRWAKIKQDFPQFSTGIELKPLPPKTGLLLFEDTKNIVFNSRVKRKPLKETKRVSSEQNGDYVQLNQYKLQVIHDTKLVSVFE